MQITKDSRIKDILNTASGHDTIARVLYSIGLDENALRGPIGLLKLKQLKTLSLNKIDDDFINAIIELLNTQNEEADNSYCEIKPAWFKEAVFYEIYPRSFKDSNDDGIGDILGIISKLDYLKDLGVNALWVCPFYDSPNDDNGYDIRDYKKIMKEFGTLNDVSKLFKEAHKRDIKVIIDLVMNHTSDEHIWFKKALKGDKKYQDYYIFKDQKNNWTSLFGGEAWNYYPEINKYALHLFSKKQMDLNWDNPDVRKEMYDIATYWLKKGCDGFRLDVVSFISKHKDLPDGNDGLSKLIGFRGIEHYVHGPFLDEYLREFNKNTIEKYNAYTVGECPGNGIQMSRLITGDDRHELSQVFSFDHIDNPGKIRYFDFNFDVRKMIPELVRWQTEYSNHCWPTIFFDNHDNPRMISKVCKDNNYYNECAKMLATIQFTLKGTPYMYQGCEIGMDNYPFSSLDEYRDVEAFGWFNEYKAKGYKEEDLMKSLLSGSRDHARIPVSWDNSKYAGFSNVQPWINVNPSKDKINVKDQLKDPDSILNYTKKLIKLRKDNKGLIYGEFKKIKTNKNLFIYKRKYKDENYLIIINLSKEKMLVPIDYEGQLLASNYKDITDILRPYEAQIFKI